MKKPEQGITKFAWQDGYAAFSVSSSKLEAVIKYIRNQEEHHKEKSFEEEVAEFMEQYDVDEYDQKYFFS